MLGSSNSIACANIMLNSAVAEILQEFADKLEESTDFDTDLHELIKDTIKDYVPDEEDFLNRLDDMTEQAFDDQCTGANPRYPLFSEIKQMYLNAYYGNNSETV